MPAKTRLTTLQWKTLQEESKEVLRRLNILDLVKPLKNKHSPAEAKTLPKPYVLLRISTCSLCKTTFNTYFRMLPAPTNPYLLQGENVSSDSILSTEDIIEETEHCLTCSYCYKILEKESKEELIKRIIILTRSQR
jgi:hypothetical protein